MSMTIWKSPLEAADLQFVEMPRGARVLTVQVQGGVTPCLWALCDPAAAGMEA